MRSDLTKVLCEGERKGDRSYTGCIKGLEKRYAYQNEEDKAEYGEYDSLPKHEGMKRRLGYNTRDFAENLQALRGLLRKNVGRRWDIVYSELCRVASPAGSNIMRHVHQHLRDYVDIKTQLCADNTIQIFDGFGWVDLTQSRNEFYVCPNSRLLKVNKTAAKRAKFNWKEQREKEIATFFRFDALTDTIYAKLNDLWYAYELEPPHYEMIYGTSVCRNPDRLAADISKWHGDEHIQKITATYAPYHATHRAQCSAKTLKQQGLL